MNKKTAFGKLLVTLDKRWKFNSKKETDFDLAIDKTMVDVEKYIEKNNIKVISKYSFGIVADSNTISNKAQQQFKIAMIELKETIKNIFKTLLERCTPIQIIFDTLEVVCETKFIIMTLDTTQKNVPPRGFTLKVIK